MALGKLNRLDLLAKVYTQVRIPQVVYDETVVQGLARGYDDARVVRIFWKQHRWPVEEVPKRVLTDYRPPVELGVGERHVLALARTLTAPLVLLDDEAARSEARRLGLRVKGTLGVLVEAHRQGDLAFDELELLVEEIEARPDLWISSKLCRGVLAKLRKPAAGRASPEGGRA